MNSETSLNWISIEYSVLFTEVSLNRVRGVHRGSIVHTDVHCHMSFMYISGMRGIGMEQVLCE